MTQDPAVPSRGGATRGPRTAHDPDTTDVAGDQASRVAGTASSEASRLGDQASASMGSVAAEARSQVRGVADTAMQQVRLRADEQVGQAGDGLRHASEQLHALARGNPDEAGPMGDYVESAADAVAGWADRLGDGGIDRLLGDLADFARRKPGQFLAGAFVAGIVAGRVGRSVQAADVDLPDRPDADATDPSTPDANTTHDGNSAANVTDDSVDERPAGRPIRPGPVVPDDAPASTGRGAGSGGQGGSSEPDWIGDLDEDGPTRQADVPGSPPRRRDPIEGRP